MNRLAAYQIEILDFDKRVFNHRNGKNVLFDTKGTYTCNRCHWEGDKQAECPKCGNFLYPKSKIKSVDNLPVAPRRTMVELFSNHKRAMKWGARFGTVISCHKVDKSCYLENIEHLNLHQEPLTIEIENDDFVLSRTLELERPRRQGEPEKFSVELG